MPGLPRSYGGARGGREQQAGQRVRGADQGCGPRRAVLGCAGRVYEVGHAVQRQASQTPPGQPSNQPPHTEHCPPPDAVAGVGVVGACFSTSSQRQRQ